ncbi:hypothetical protein ACRAWF_39390 [Streptomyces sp. L7]
MTGSHISPYGEIVNSPNGCVRGRGVDVPGGRPRRQHGDPAPPHCTDLGHRPRARDATCRG